jgi:hypothetical protein
MLSAMTLATACTTRLWLLTTRPTRGFGLPPFTASFPQLLFGRCWWTLAIHLDHQNLTVILRCRLMSNERCCLLAQAQHQAEQRGEYILDDQAEVRGQREE